MAISLNRSQMLLAEVNNFTSGQTRVWIKDKEMPLEKICDLLLAIFKGNNYQFSSGEHFLERVKRMAVVPGFSKYAERLGLPADLPNLDKLLHERQLDKLALCPFTIEEFDIDFFDLTVFTEYLLTNSDLMSRRDPRLKLWEDLKAIQKYSGD